MTIAEARKEIADAFAADPDFRDGYVANVAMLLHDHFGITGFEDRNKAGDMIVKLIFESDNAVSDDASAMMEVPKDHPLMIAWTAYRETLEFANTEKWAHIEAHLLGSLWAVFSKGFEAGQKNMEIET